MRSLLVAWLRGFHILFALLFINFVLALPFYLDGKILRGSLVGEVIALILLVFAPAGYYYLCRLVGVRLDSWPEEPRDGSNEHCPSCGASYSFESEEGLRSHESETWRKFCKNCDAEIFIHP